MSYPALYAHCQTLSPKVRRNAVRDKILELTNKQKIAVVKTTLDTSLCRGFYLSADNTEHQLVRQFGTELIVIARGLNYCWDRMVYVKELMHQFDFPASTTDTPAKLEIVLSEFMTSSPDPSSQTSAEWYAIWMALSALCPEEVRLQYAADREAGLIDDYSIALKLSIPQLYVPNLFEVRYRRIIDYLLSQG